MTNRGKHRIRILSTSPGALAFALALAIVLAHTFVASQPAQAQTFKVIYSFTGGEGGNGPSAGLTMDAAGNLYGTTAGGGNNQNFCYDQGCGTVYKLTHKASGWVLNSLYVFLGPWTDGYVPVSRVVFGPDGALYGTTRNGGNQNDCENSGYGYGCGIVYRLAPPTTACKTALCQWRETILYYFNTDGGGNPLSEVVFDGAGNLYGTTAIGGLGNGCFYDGGCGAVYELSPANGGWVETVLYGFPTSPNDGQVPEANVVFDSQGNLYGTTAAGGSSNRGTVFELSPTSSGWTENVLYSFAGGSDGSEPESGLVLDGAGNLYGGTFLGGSGGSGTVFELAPSGGTWTFTTLYGLSGGHGGGPAAALTMDAAGNLYGTTVSGGAYGKGSVFKLTPSNGAWTYTSLYDFTGGGDGAGPYSSVIIDSAGNLYGTARGGGSGNCFNGCGVVWEITP